MADNEKVIGQESQDADFEKAKKSMGNRVDPDPTPEEPKKEEEKKPDEPAKPAEEPKKAPDEEPKTPEEPKKPEEAKPEEGEGKPKDRPVAYIPVSQYTDEKKIWKKDVDERDTKIKDLEDLLAKGESSPKKDDEVRELIDQLGISDEDFDKLTKIIEKRVLPEEKRKLLDEFYLQAEDRQEMELFQKEFTTLAVPELTKSFGDIPAEKLPAIEKYLDQVSHTKDFHDKELSYVIFKHQDEIKKLVGDATTPEKKPESHKSMESGRIGAGKPGSVTAKDFAGKTDFSELEGLEPEERNRIIKDMDIKTYQNLISFAANQNKGVEVMRSGRKIFLKS